MLVEESADGGGEFLDSAASGETEEGDMSGLAERVLSTATGVPRPMLALGAVALLLGSCLNPALEPQPLTVTLTASPESTAVGRNIRFRYESRGTNLSRTVVEYGTADSDTVPFIYTGGAPVNIHSQAGYFDYAYDEPGTYVARATVSTVAGDSRSARVTVRIDGP